MHASRKTGPFPASRRSAARIGSRLEAKCVPLLVRAAALSGTSLAFRLALGKRGLLPKVFRVESVQGERIMTYVLPLLAFLRVAEIAIASTAMAPAAIPESIQGTISAVAEKQIVVATKGEQRPFEVTAATKITLDGQEVKITSLPVGSPVVVTAEKGEKEMRAVTIVAMSLK
jgi:hypothetical protein